MRWPPGLRALLRASPFALVVALVACSGEGPEEKPLLVSIESPDGSVGADDAAGDARGMDAVASDAPVTRDAGVDAGNGCEWGGAPGECMTVSACAALADHSSYANECPGAATVECCIVTPNVDDNPPTPAGWELMQQAQVTSAMTTWAVDILDAPEQYPMFSTTTMFFGTLDVLARVEWHPPDFQNSVIHRGVTLYERAD